MSPSRLRSGELLAGGSAAALLLVSFLDWFGGEDVWQSLSVLRVFVAVAVAAGLLVALLAVLRLAVAIPVAAAVLTTALAALATVLLLYRVAVNEPGDNATVGLDTGAYVGVLLCALIAYGAWRVLDDERTQSEDSRRQTERVLAVHPTPRRAASSNGQGSPDAIADPSRPDRPPG